MLLLNKRRVSRFLLGKDYCANAFYLGTLQKLLQINVLNKIGILPTIFKRLIIDAYYCLNIDDSYLLEFCQVTNGSVANNGSFNVPYSQRIHLLINHYFK